MDYDSAVTELFTRFPRLRRVYQQKFAQISGEPPSPYIVFGSVLLPALEHGLEEGDLGTILPICAFLEDAAESAQSDNNLEVLLRIEVGKWLGWMDNEAYLTPWLGEATKRICGYVPRLATQRRTLRKERQERISMNRILNFLRKLTGQ
jgi:hypothetical protein